MNLSPELCEQCDLLFLRGRIFDRALEAAIARDDERYEYEMDRFWSLDPSNSLNTLRRAVEA